MKKELQFNRIREVFTVKNRSNSWVAHDLGNAEMSVSRWCTNKSQPNIAGLFGIAKVLGIEANELIESFNKILMRSAL